MSFFLVFVKLFVCVISTGNAIKQHYWFIHLAVCILGCDACGKFGEHSKSQSYD